MGDDVPDVVAAVDDHAGVGEPGAFGVEGGVGVVARIVVPVDVEGGLVGDEEVAAGGVGGFEGGPLGLPCHRDGADFGVGVAGFVGVDGGGPVDPGAELAHVGVEVNGAHRG